MARQEERRKKKFKKEKESAKKGRDKPRAERRAEGQRGPKQGAPANPNQQAPEEDVHPSWAAKKQANTATIVPFEGKRITFD
jgi:hypothetical protein